MTEALKGPKPATKVDTAWDIGSFGVDEKGTFYVEGYGSTFLEDLGHEIVTPEAARDAESQLLGMIILFNHDVDQAVGVIKAARFDDHGLYIKATVKSTRQDLITDIQVDQIPYRFSIRLLELETAMIDIGGRFVKAITKMVLKEVSITSLPMNITAEITQAYNAKSLKPGGIEMSKTVAALEVFEATIKGLLADVQKGKEGLKTMLSSGKTEDVPMDPQPAGDGVAVSVKADAVPVTPDAPPAVTIEQLKAVADQLNTVEASVNGILEATKSLFQNLTEAIEVRFTAMEASITTLKSDDSAAVAVKSLGEQIEALKSSVLTGSASLDDDPPAVADVPVAKPTKSVFANMVPGGSLFDQLHQ